MESLYVDQPWEESREFFRLLAGHLVQAWRAAEAGDADALRRLDNHLSARLPADAAERSIRAGLLLLRSTRGARYQGVLGRLRRANEDGLTPGHFLTVWAAVGHFFQISVTNVLAEYLRLEAGFSSKEVRSADAAEQVARFTRELLREEAANLRLLVDPAPEHFPLGRYTNLT